MLVIYKKYIFIHEKWLYHLKERKHSGFEKNRTVVKYRKPFKPNIALLILLIIIAYVVVISWNYFHDEHISIYEVNETSIADDSTLTGFILREESVVYSEQAGYINFYHADQSKVGKKKSFIRLTRTER